MILFQFGITRQQELEDLTRQVLSAEPDSISAEIGRIRQLVTGQLGDVRQRLRVDVQEANAELEKHVSEIRMIPKLKERKATTLLKATGTY